MLCFKETIIHPLGFFQMFHGFPEALHHFSKISVVSYDPLSAKDQYRKEQVANAKEDDDYHR